MVLSSATDSSGFLSASFVVSAMGASPEAAGVVLVTSVAAAVGADSEMVGASPVGAGALGAVSSDMLKMARKGTWVTVIKRC